MSIDREHLLDLVARAKAAPGNLLASPGSDYVGEAAAEFENAGFDVEEEVPWLAIAMRAQELRDADDARDDE